MRTYLGLVTKPVAACLLGSALVAFTLAFGGLSSEASAAQSGGTLTLIASTPPISLNPADTNAGAGEQFEDLAYSSLIRWVGQNDFKAGLAKSFKFLNKNNTAFQITLRPNVKFSDGQLLNAAAVKQYVEYFENANGPFSATAKSEIKAITTPNSTTVDFTFKAPNPDAPTDFSEGGFWGSVVSPSVLDGKTSQLGYSTDGAGPYELDTSETVSGSSYTYVKNPNYFDPAQQKWTDVVVKVIASPNADLQALATTPNSWTQITPEQISTAKSDGLKVAEAGQDVYALFLSDRAGHVTPALGKLKVRQALNYAVDRPAIAKLLHGTANEQIIAKGYPGYFSGDVYSYNVAKAKKLLAEAGYPHGFTFTTIVSSYDPNATLAAQAFVSEFAKIGVTMKLVTAPTFQDFSEIQGSKKYSADVENWGSNTMYSVASQLLLPSGVVNVWHDSNAQMNALFDEAAALPSGSAAADRKWAALSKVSVEQAWYVPVASIPETVASTKNLNTLGDALSYPNPLYF